MDADFNFIDSDSFDADLAWRGHESATAELAPGMVDSAAPDYYMVGGGDSEAGASVMDAPAKPTLDADGYLDSGTFLVQSDWVAPGQTHTRKMKLKAKGYDVECCGGCADGSGCSGGGDDPPMPVDPEWDNDPKWPWFEPEWEDPEPESEPVDDPFTGPTPFGISCCDGTSFLLWAPPPRNWKELYCKCPDGSAQADKPPCCPEDENICGPDVTDWFIRDLRKHIEYAKGNDGIPAEPTAMHTQLKYLTSHKWMRFEARRPGAGPERSAECPKGPECVGTVMVAGVCLRNNQLGNIVAASIIKAYGGLLWWSSDDLISDNLYAKSKEANEGKSRADSLAAFAAGNLLHTLIWAYDELGRQGKMRTQSEKDAAIVKDMKWIMSDDVSLSMYRNVDPAGTNGVDMADALTKVGRGNTRNCKRCRFKVDPDDVSRSSMKFGWRALRQAEKKGDLSLEWIHLAGGTKYDKLPENPWSPRGYKFNWGGATYW